MHRPCRIGRSKPAAAVRNRIECSGLQNRRGEQCLLRKHGHVDLSPARSGGHRGRGATLAAEAPLAPGEDGSFGGPLPPFGSVTVDSLMITAALALVPDLGEPPDRPGGAAGRQRRPHRPPPNVRLPTRCRGNFAPRRLGSWKLAATLPNVGSTCGLVLGSAVRGGPSGPHRRGPRWVSWTSLLVQETRRLALGAGNAPPSWRPR